MGTVLGGGASWDDDADIRDDDCSMFGASLRADRFEKRKLAKEILKDRETEDITLEDIDRVVDEELSDDL